MTEAELQRDDASGCARMFAQFAETTAKRAPLYAELARGIAADDALAGLLLLAPVTQRQPVLLFACVHAMLLESPDDPLARFYPNLTEQPAGGDPLPAFADLCRRRAAELAALLGTRRTQTNEIGRCALLLPAFGIVADEVGRLAHLDVGASAGLNLLLDRYSYEYEPGGAIGPTSPVTLTCGTRGEVPIPAELPPVVTRRGLDQDPVDVHDDERTRWLEACVWPDQKDRFDRLRAALELARQIDVDVRAGDAAADTAKHVDELAADGHPIVTTTWVLNYLTTEQRTTFVEALDDVGSRRDLSWVYLESRYLTPELPGPSSEAVDPSALVLVRWRDGRRCANHLANAHPHGYWLHWNELS